MKKEEEALILVDGVDVRSRLFLETPTWKRLRYAALARVRGRCELCGRSQHDGIALNVDHILPRARHPLLATDEHNLQVLCADCNAGKGNISIDDWRQGGLTLKQAIEQFRAVLASQQIAAPPGNNPLVLANAYRAAKGLRLYSMNYAAAVIFIKRTAVGLPPRSTPAERAQRREARRRRQLA